MYVIIPAKDILFNTVYKQRERLYVPHSEEVLKYLEGILDYAVELSVTEGPFIDPDLLDSYFIELYFNWVDYDPMLDEHGMYDQFFEIFKNLYNRINDYLTKIKIDQHNTLNPSRCTCGPYQLLSFDIAINVEIKSSNEQ